MASVFTFDPDPPRVSSPWSVSARQSPRLEDETRRVEKSRAALSEDFEELQLAQIDDLHVTRLDAEPQEGPTEYKLHLLLRPRRSLSTTTTARHVSGSHQSHSPASSPRAHARLGSPYAPAPPLSSSAASRQHRLEQLTTQLLWRLQQSSPHHSSSASNVILPSIPDASAVVASAPLQPAKLVPGLEESRGALYEIGVSDDGTFVGLTRDEMTESLNNLRAMAASLGCSVQILRMVPVGECEWQEDGSSQLAAKVRRGRLYVAEAYVKPELRNAADSASDALSRARVAEPTTHHASSEQLRVSIIGATTCGKSTLLGTLSTSTLDNGRGKSRLSLLKHRHEIVSGMTSSVAQEMVGYRDGSVLQVVNYGTKDVVSWNDIHAESSPGRLALLSDSAGHPRYRRTTVRGLLGWAPHWTLLCVAANGGPDNETSTPLAAASFAGASTNLSMAHLDLCLRLDLQLVVVITKLDAANKTTFRTILSSLLSLLKAAGRKPVILPNDAGVSQDTELQTVSAQDTQSVLKLVDTLRDEPLVTVPILFTSAVKGNGMGKLHSLLRYLPIPKSDWANGREQSLDHGQTSVLFHIDDIFTLPSHVSDRIPGSSASQTGGSIVSGHLRRGTISVGDELLLGPFSYSGAPTKGATGASGPEWMPNSQPDDAFLTPRSFGEALADAMSSSRVRATAHEQQWRRVRVVSTRNLRLPVQALQEDQAGTVGLVFAHLDKTDDDEDADQTRDPTDHHTDHHTAPEIRKGMILTGEHGQTRAAHSFTASFHLQHAGSVVVGSSVVVYCASVRESAKIVAVALDSNGNQHDDSSGHTKDDSSEFGDDEGAFAFDWDGDNDDGKTAETPAAQHGPSVRASRILVTFRFTAYWSWLEQGAKVLVMSGSSGQQAGGGFDGLVGSVVSTFA